MNSYLIPMLVLAGLAILLGLLYNRLVILKNRYKNAFSQIDVQLKRRYDLIPNLVEVAKKYLEHERRTLEAVIQARNKAITASDQAKNKPDNASSLKELIGAESALTGAMQKFMALVESYPDLKGVATMGQLTEELSSTENKISFARQAYNDAVMAYNSSKESFPNVLIAKLFGFPMAQLFELESADERKAVKVSFEN